MPRLRQVPRAEAPADVQKIYDMLFGGRDPVAEPGTATGTRGDWWTTFAVVPDVLRHCVSGFAFYRSKARKLDPKLRELGQLRAGFACGSQFVFSQHCKAARRNGVKRFLVATSNHAVGFYPVTQTIDHRVYPKPDSRYGVSKVFNEALASLYADRYGMQMFCMRIGNVNRAPIDRRRAGAMPLALISGRLDRYWFLPLPVLGERVGVRGFDGYHTPSPPTPLPEYRERGDDAGTIIVKALPY